MDSAEVRKLKEDIQISYDDLITFIETHISWILLSPDYVYKIKKPLKLSFLDFSTLAQRKYYCEQEVLLNRRLTNDMYLGVLPIYDTGKEITIKKTVGVPIDYCVKMRRIDNSREMRVLLQKDQVTNAHLHEIARQLTRFHKETDIIKGRVNGKKLWDDFSDIGQVEDFIITHIGKEAGVLLNRILKIVEAFLVKKNNRIIARDRSGFTRDCHGDLHSGNIFLLEEPVIFDCIEFNEHFRQIDILNELAFLCMDLEYFNRPELSDYFLKTYLKEYAAIENDQDEELFLFYKLYRGNVKVKVNAIKCMQANSKSVFDDRLALLQQYWKLLLQYFYTLEDLVI